MFRLEAAKDARGKQAYQIINQTDDVKFIPRTPEMEDLGVIRKTKRVAFLDSESETDDVTETDEYSSDSKRGTLDRFVSF